MIPSPTIPTIYDWAPVTLGDEEAQSRIVRGDDIKGVRTGLYKYQMVCIQRAQKKGPAYTCDALTELALGQSDDSDGDGAETDN
jgi:hypothetical protein